VPRVADPQTTARLRELLDRLDEARAGLEQAESAEDAIDRLQQLADLAKEAQAEIDRARRAPPRGSAPGA
jgi:hypothetical protein